MPGTGHEKPIIGQEHHLNKWQNILLRYLIRGTLQTTFVYCNTIQLQLITIETEEKEKCQDVEGDLQRVLKYVNILHS